MTAVSRNSLLPIVTSVLLLGQSAPTPGDDGLDQRLSTTLEQLHASYEGYERATVPEDGHAKTYLLLDFDDRNLARREERQRRIHHICSRILTNRDLVRDLSEQGVHMVSVAFNRDYQYDCL